MTSSSGYPHKQVPVRVPILIDTGIKRLVEELNRLDGVRTLSSCQGSKDVHSCVVLEYGDSSRVTEESYTDLCAFLFHFITCFRDCSNRGWSGEFTDISLEWSGEKVHPTIRIVFPSEYIKGVTRIITQVRKRLSHGSTSHRQQ